jgi:preprotein translocase subunit Sss1
MPTTLERITATPERTREPTFTEPPEVAEHKGLSMVVLGIVGLLIVAGIITALVMLTSTSGELFSPEITHDQVPAWMTEGAAEPFSPETTHTQVPAWMLE